VIRAMPAVVLAPVLLAAVAPGHGPPQRFRGVFSSAFEFSAFDGCWLTFSRKAGRQFYARVGPQGHDGQRYRMIFLGRRSPASGGTAGNYGHLGAYPCEIEVLELRRVRPIGPIKR